MSYGENITLLIDLACCYYQLGEVDLWRESYTQLIERQKKTAHLLGADSRHFTHIMLGKFLEEEGRAAQALDHYEQALQWATPKKDKNTYYFETLPQIIRLKVMYRDQSHLSPLYSELLSLRQDKVAKAHYVECQHSLMLAEIILVSPEMAWARVQQHLEDPEAQP